MSVHILHEQVADPPDDQTIPAQEIDYPEDDGTPMGESGIHVRAILYLYDALRNFFQFYHKRQDVYVAADMFLYYEEGNPSAQKSPDVMVIFGVDASYERRSFRIWEENAVPSVIFEVSSRSTWVEDMGPKGSLYAELGVAEYFIFDPLGEFLVTPFLGLRLEEGSYVQIDPEADGSLISQELQARLVHDGDLLKVFDLASGKAVPALSEDHERMLRAEQRATEAEQEIERLRAQIEELRQQ